LQNFKAKTINLANSTLPGLKEGFGLDDIFTMGLIEIEKKQLNDLCSNCISMINQANPMVDMLETLLQTYGTKIGTMALLGDLVNSVKQKALMLMVVHVFQGPNLDINLDQSLAKIQGIFDDIVMVISFAIDIAGFPEIGIALQILGFFIDGIFSTIEIAQKISKLEDFQKKLQSAYASVAQDYKDVQKQLDTVNQTFSQLRVVLQEIGNPNVKTDDDVVREYVAVQTAFNGINSEYEHLAPTLKANPSVLDPIFDSISKGVGYGTVTRRVFFLVLYALDNVPSDQIEGFLSQHNCQVPTGGIKQLVDVVNYVRKSFHS